MKYCQKSIIAFIGASVLAVFATGNMNTYSLCAIALLFLAFLIEMMSFSNQIKARSLEDLIIVPPEHAMLIAKSRKQFAYGFVFLIFALAFAAAGQVSRSLHENRASIQPQSPTPPKTTKASPSLQLVPAQ